MNIQSTCLVGWDCPLPRHPQWVRAERRLVEGVLESVKTAYICAFSFIYMHLYILFYDFFTIFNQGMGCIDCTVKEEEWW